ncbi:hypothetical protein RyT2_06420 [Pseudolactococcus yaeyamensis]
MKLQYKHQKFQENAVNAVTQVFQGQPKQSPFQYLVDTGNSQKISLLAETGFKNARLLYLKQIY